MRTLYYSHPDFLGHDTGVAHPESVDRLHVIEQALSGPEFSGLQRVEPIIPADIQDKIGLVHSKAMIAKVLATIPTQGLANLDADTVVSPGSKQAGLRAVAAVCDAVDRICSGQNARAFCAVRPPGHHAMPDYAMGFCLFNNIAIAAEYARSRYGLTRIAIVDFDVHHGNGTQAAFYEQPQVLYASSHQWPHYPGSGHPSETGVGNIINVPLPSGSGGEVFREKYRQAILPAVKKFNPELILVSAGFDAHRDDPLASLTLLEDDYRWITDELNAIADTCCQGRIISALEGGYNLRALASSVAVHVASLMGLETDGE
ncbi:MULTISPECIES: histone deacetylase family protein [Methylomonas]|uniref:Acetoin utilization protein n=2 Tax=Methylomonas TaxID=416 RepID=A0A140E6H5_9GAMM|nr:MULTISPECIES: histone deacetylase family protein [Methylomonas]AMK78999.1 acetoin utilization protein [Methylomonas denitrificans]OAH96947.1 acetoin utilization protein [Methylomonas methanica]TCV74219.1 acetoin utilization deacetylase AcuC-like enzyme [Methylomonas methanica]